jgi:hypothetical protein
MRPLPLENPDEITSAMESSQSAVSWPAIFAGGVVAFAFAFILLALGSGIGLSSVSPYGNAGISLTAFAISGAVWLIVVQWLSSALGGYIAGRLRTKWANLHADETMFRDTAHGLLAWAVAVALGAGLFGLAAAVAAKENTATVRTAYYVDELFRSKQTAGGVVLAEDKSQATHVLEMAAIDPKAGGAGRPYLSQLVASATGLSAADSDQRVLEVMRQAQSDADAARKAAARISFYSFFSMLIGAFIACTAGAIGGRQRDLY